jgi:DNA-binding XRE family transcriptional regulator
LRASEARREHFEPIVPNLTAPSLLSVFGRKGWAGTSKIMSPKVLEIALYCRGVMNVLEIAEKHLGERTLRKLPKLRAALRRIEGSLSLNAERERIASIVDLCFEFDRETDPDEKEDILRTLEEISADRPAELPTESIEDWEQRLKETDFSYARVDAAASRKTGAFLKAYFSLRAKARLATQADVARKSGLSRSYVAVIESGEHVPQQKTLQKLARAFGVDVTALIP